MNVEIQFEAEAEKSDLRESWEPIIREMSDAVLYSEHCPYDCEIEVLVTDDEGIREINREQRKIDSPTDVLSFPMVFFISPSDFSSVDENDPGQFDPESGLLLLGDIVLNMNRVKSQAIDYGHSWERELAFLVTHSMLHLLGYDHMEEKDRLLMEKRQEEILSERGYVR